MSKKNQVASGSSQSSQIGKFVPISIDREALTIMGIPFPTLDLLESTAAALGSNMFEGFVPTPK
ncbi:MAG: hypothetical protein FWE48_05605, partial [Coriobacteriia bacterium]|nr:hypothetical protein [Coriobacteriia bacterium]